MCVPKTDTVQAVLEKPHPLIKGLIGVETHASAACRDGWQDGSMFDDYVSGCQVPGIELAYCFVAAATPLNICLKVA